MLKKIGRFDAYYTEKNPYDIVKNVIALSFVGSEQEFVSPPHEIHKFFFNMKNKYAELMEDIFFNYDPDFPYSEEIDEAFTRLQESGFVTRPNPSFYRYRISSDLTSTSKIVGSYSKEINDLADEFRARFSA